MQVSLILFYCLISATAKKYSFFINRVNILLQLLSFDRKGGYKTIKYLITKIFPSSLLLSLTLLTCIFGVQEAKSQVQIGAYYFDGWAGQNSKANDPKEPWAVNAPVLLTRKLVEEFKDREPVWGWRDDTQAIMEKQIDLAAANGIKFFLFCWYWKDSNGPINPSAIESLSLHTSMNLYLKAQNKNKIKFGLLIANHGGSEIKGTENWEKATKYWMKYFKDPQYITVGGKPLVVIYNPSGIDADGLARMQDISQKEGLQGLSIAGCGNTINEDFTYRTHYSISKGYATGSENHKYSELVDVHKKAWMGTEKQPYIPEISAGWDKRPWEGPTGLNQEPGWYYTDRTPKQFKNFLNDAIQWMDSHPTQTTKERIVLIYAWNELGEGGYLVPTKGDPKASYLKMIRSVVFSRP